jgi:hypothetical protein
MQKLLKAIENVMVAITFAEAGEYDEAQKLTLQDLEKDVVPSTDRMKTIKA